MFACLAEIGESANARDNVCGGKFELLRALRVPLEAIGTSRLVIEPMAITSIVQLDDGTLCHLRRLTFLHQHHQSFQHDQSSSTNVEDSSVSDT